MRCDTKRAFHDNRTNKMLLRLVISRADQPYTQKRARFSNI